MRELAFFFKEEDFDEKKERKKESERDFEKKGKKNWSTSSSLAKNVRSSLLISTPKSRSFFFLLSALDDLTKTNIKATA